MVGASDHKVAAVEAKCELAVRAAAFALQLDSEKRLVFDLDGQFLDGSDQCYAAIGFPPQ